VPRAKRRRACEPLELPRGGSDRSGRAHVGPLVGCARGPPRTLHGGRPAAVPDGPRATQPKRGDGATEDHAEGAVAEEPAVTPGRPGAALSGIAGVLALSRTVVFLRTPGFSGLSRYNVR